MPELAIVILNWNGLEFLKKFLGTVLRYSTRPSTEIYVVDNGSSDDSVKWIIEHFREVKLVRFETNNGFAGGYNIALEQIAAKYYLLLNSDIEVTEGWIEPLLIHMKNNPGCAACQPRVHSWFRKDFFEYAGASGGYIDKYGYPFCRGRIFSHIEKDEGQYNDNVRVFWTSGACMMVRSDAWKKCGGFDASFFAHMEEIDLCWRFNKAGYSLECVPESFVYHVGGGTLSYNSPYKTYLNFRNSLYMLYKNLDQNDLRRIMFLRRLLDGIAALTFLARGHFKSFLSVWRAHMDYNKNLPQLKVKRSDIQKNTTGYYSLPVLNKSIVFEFYARGKRTFKSLDLIFK